MGRPKKDKSANGDGSAAPPKAGHNGGVSEAVFLRHMGNVRRLNELKDVAVANIRTARKTAKGDGIDLKLLDETMKEQDLTPQELISKHNTTKSYREWAGLPIGSQMNLVDQVTGAEMTPDIVASEARAEGQQAGLRGEGVEKCPHDPNSDSGRAWMLGQEIGQQKMRDAMQFDMEKRQRDADAEA